MPVHKCGRLIKERDTNNANADILIMNDHIVQMGSLEGQELQITCNDKPYKVKLLEIEMSEPRRPSWTFEDFTLIRARVEMLSEN